jgi:hypothetical protein
MITVGRILPLISTPMMPSTTVRILKSSNHVVTDGLLGGLTAERDYCELCMHWRALSVLLLYRELSMHGSPVIFHGLAVFCESHCRLPHLHQERRHPSSSNTSPKDPSR